MDLDVQRADVFASRGGPVRRAEVRDAARLTLLRGYMIASMGVDVGPDDAPWRAECTAHFAMRLEDRTRFAAFVVDDDRGVPIASAVGFVGQHLPGPESPADVGFIASVSVDPAHRRLGHARVLMTTLIDWFRTETVVRRVDLNATEEGAPLYRELGFAPPHAESLRLLIPR